MRGLAIAPVNLATSVAAWVRPSDWVALPTIGSQEFHGLMAVMDDETNFVALLATTSSGTYHVDWGDGTTSDVTSNVNAEHQYTYADADLNGTECWSRGVNKDVAFTDAGDLVTLAGHALANGTAVRFSAITTTTGISVDTTYYVVNATTNTFQVEASVGGGALALTTNGTGKLLVAAYRQAIIRVTPNTGNLTSINIQTRHATMGNLVHESGWLDVALNSSTVTTLIVGGSTVRIRILEQAVIGSHAVTNMSSMFYICYSLTSVPLFNTAAVTNMSQMFVYCNSLASVPLFNTAAVTNMSSMFYICNSLASVPLFNTAAVTDMSYMFANCSSLASVPRLVSSGVTTGNFGSMLQTCSSLARGVLAGTKFTISYASCKLSKAAIEAIFDALGIGTGQTITVTGNYGSPAVTSKASSGTTAASPTITMAATSGLATGMEITGTGVSDALACTIETAANTITIANHGIPNGTPVSLATLVTSTGIAVDTIYYVVSTATNTLQLALTAGGSAIDITGSDGSGTLRRPMTISSISTNVSITASANCSATGTVTVTATALQRWKATLRGWAVTP